MFSFLFLQMWQSLSKSVIFQWSNDSVFFNRLTGEVGTLYLGKVALLFVRCPDTLSLDCPRREQLSTQKPYFTSPACCSASSLLFREMGSEAASGGSCWGEELALSSQGLCRRNCSSGRRLLANPALLWRCDHSAQGAQTWSRSSKPLSAPGVLAFCLSFPAPLSVQE